jgi:Endosomal/lysosomal potassium channel TMEM175
VNRRVVYSASAFPCHYSAAPTSDRMRRRGVHWAAAGLQPGRSPVGVPTTLLVVDVRLGEGVDPDDAQQLLDALFGLRPKFFPYGLSFLVLGLRWLSKVQVRSRAETVSANYATCFLLNLLSSVILHRVRALTPDAALGIKLAYPFFALALFGARHRSDGRSLL